MKNYIDSSNLRLLAEAGDYETLECLALADRRSATRAKAVARNKALKAARKAKEELEEELRIAPPPFEREWERC